MHTLRAAFPEVPISRPGSMERIVHAAQANLRFQTLWSGSLALAGAVLALANLTSLLIFVLRPGGPSRDELRHWGPQTLGLGG